MTTRRNSLLTQLPEALQIHSTSVHWLRAFTKQTWPNRITTQFRYKFLYLSAGDMRLQNTAHCDYFYDLQSVETSLESMSPSQVWYRASHSPHDGTHLRWLCIQTASCTPLQRRCDESASPWWTNDVLVSSHLLQHSHRIIDKDGWAVINKPPNDSLTVHQMNQLWANCCSSHC